MIYYVVISDCDVTNSIIIHETSTLYAHDESLASMVDLQGRQNNISFGGI